MTVSTLLSRTGTLVTVTETGPEDIYGNATEAETETTVRYELQQQQRSESNDPNAWQVGVWRLFLPAGTSVVGVDRFIDDEGVEYEFHGPPWAVHNPRAGNKSHVEATVRAVS